MLVSAALSILLYSYTDFRSSLATLLVADIFLYIFIGP